MGRAKYFTLLLAAMVLASCETAEQHKPLVKLPSAAMAPAPPKVAPAPKIAQKAPPKREPPSKITAISQLIDRAEADYTAGVEDYQAGNFEKARQEFDQSLSVLLTSPYDIRSDQRLSQEFDLLADHINNAEVSAFEQGNSLSAHQYQPTPIESFSGLTFPVDPNVARRVQQEVRSVHLDIPLVSNETVSGVIAYFQNHARGYIENVLKGIDEYGPMISAALRQQGLPHDLLYLPGPESAFNPHATSRKGAKGLWQLMRSTAALHGLKDNRWIDEREDPYRSTQAAAVDLKSLYKEFGDWYLALAAYDSGPLTVQHAIQETGYADYWKLRQLHVLPPETENYVPVFLATALIAKDPQAYGFAPASATPIKADRVPVTDPADLRLVAGLVGQPVGALVSLNPGLKGYETPARDPTFRLNLPLGTKGLFEKEIALVPASKRLWWRAGQLQNGETLADFARRFRIVPAALVAANHITADDPPSPGSTLLIPLAPVRTRMASSVRWTRRRYYYRVRRGDNLDLIADRFNVSPYQIRRWNHLRSSRLVSGRRLLVYRLVAVSRTPSRHRRSRRLVRHHRRRTTAAVRK